MGKAGLRWGAFMGIGLLLVAMGLGLSYSATSSQPPPATTALLALGKRVYEKQCAACHGLDGRGTGTAAYLLYPKPRDFVAARYRLVSTWEGTPTDQDLFNTITRGMPGSAMPSWGHLPELTRWGLVYYIKSFAEQPWVVQPATAPSQEGEAGTGLIAVPPEPAFTPEAQAQAAFFFNEACASCHGPQGRGDGPDAGQLVNDEGYATRPRDLTSGVYKGSPAPEAIYRHIVTGLPGTPMPENAWAYGDTAWHLVHLVRSWSSDAQRARAEMRQFTMVSRYVPRVPEHPDDGAWRLAQPVNLHLMPLWWRSHRPEELTVRVLHDDTQVAILLVWADATHDHTAMRPQDFQDAAAIAFSLTPEPPFFAMGAAGEFVNIWMWKSAQQEDLEAAFHDLEAVYPNIGIDSYPNLLRSPLEQPMRHALTLASDPTFVTGWGAGNPVSDPAQKRAAEDLVAQGFGTLRARPPQDRTVEAKGVYSTGTYHVVFRRTLVGRGLRAVTLRPGSTVPVGFAVWDGSAGDRDGKKSVTIWQTLQLQN